MNARPKVCHLLHDGSGRAGGGATFALSYFPAYLGEFDTFAITGNDGDLAERLEARGIRTRTLPMDRPWRAALSLPRLTALLREERPDAVVVHGQWGGFFGALAAQWAGVRAIVYYTHFPSFYTDWDLARTFRNRVAESVTCHIATRVVCLSEASRYQYLLRQLADESKLFCVPNCVDPSMLTAPLDRAGLLAELGLLAENDEPLAVSVCRLAGQKRVDWLLRAWAIVESRTPRGWLAVVGGGPEAEKLQRLAAELRLKRCRFLGPQRDGYRYYRAADFGVATSMFEALSLSVIEAMFLACPMVATAVDGIRELIEDGETGRLVPPADPPALAEAMLEMMENPARRRQQGEAARAVAAKNYDARNILPQQVQLLRDVITQTAKP